MSARVRIAAIALLAVTMAAPARAQAPDADWRLRLLEYRAAVRDTVGHSDDAVRLAALGEHLMQFARTEEAESIWRRVEALRPGDITASGNLGRLALVTGRLEEADRWLSVAAAGAPDGAYARDRFLVALRRGDYRAAAT
ncbi:MAG: hypothetical protein HOP12_02030, partial [Candidatus Eisenbacteria bacterium]|nr:hypothetical protein [Candidatus Eisenbacteria bacterium]